MQTLQEIRVAIAEIDRGFAADAAARIAAERPDFEISLEEAAIVLRGADGAAALRHWRCSLLNERLAAATAAHRAQVLTELFA